MVGRILDTSLHALGVCLFYLGAAPLIRRWGRKNPKILLYHDCSPSETAYTAGLRCTTHPDTFRTHVDYLVKHYNVVDVEMMVSGHSPDRALAITFDDGYASVYEHAFPILQKAGAPATVYLISSVVDNESLVWVNELNALLREGGDAAVTSTKLRFGISEAETPEEIISHCRLNYERDKMEALLEDLRGICAQPVAEHAAEARLYLSWDHIEEMLGFGIRFGNHTHTHPNMERLTEDEQITEIATAQSVLKKRLPSVSAFAHPFGHKSPNTAKLAIEAGLTSAAEVGGYNTPICPQSLGRTHLSRESIAGLFSRMELVEPVKGMLRKRIYHR
jgi:peptidoglycan/xylan/chitin deacetylase (PgdA/CDA1 family)